MDPKLISQFVTDAAIATANASNEAQLRGRLESALETVCKQEGLPWSPYTLETYLKGTGNKRRFADVIHGAVIIEYEPPRCFNGTANAAFKHACGQAEEYAELLSAVEGRPIHEYVLVVWDGATISFGSVDDKAKASWDSPLAFDIHTATRLTQAIADNGRPLVSELVLSQHIGPDTEIGAALLPELFKALVTAKNQKPATKTTLLFAEWRRLFGQVIGISNTAFEAHLKAQSSAHHVNYADADHAPAYLFALNTYIAILAKVVVACALPDAEEDIRDGGADVHARMLALEDGALFTSAGLVNMLSGDFFRWYVDDLAWGQFEAPLRALLSALGDIDFDITKKSATATRDLFKGIYETCVPRELRHALGEFYTPDWLAEHGMNVLEWQPSNQLLDPTCGSGTFLIEALRRRLVEQAKATVPSSAEQLIDGICGTDLNPLAVLSAKASIAIFLIPHIQKGERLQLPVFLADAINPATPDGDYYIHEFQTDRGNKRFTLPRAMVESEHFYPSMARIQSLINADQKPGAIVKAVKAEFADIANSSDEWDAIKGTVTTIVDLHDVGWNGIWCSILADRFAAGSITKVSHICGNPPWVKWSHLPREYAAFIKPRCDQLGVFSDDSWVGGIESDISTVITYEAIDRYLADSGKLGFFITGTVFTNESSEGFRKFELHDGRARCAIEVVEDYGAIKPFDGVTNHPTFFVVTKGKKTRYPVKYVRWSKPGKGRARYDSAKAFAADCSKAPLFAKPVPGGKPGSNRPWLTGTRKELTAFSKVFQVSTVVYTARKGVTTDRNGIFWVDVTAADGTRAKVKNLNSVGRTKGIQQRHGYVEQEHVFPLLRGKEIQPFKVSPSLHILMPQRGMHGDPDLSVHSPDTHAFLSRFKNELEKRSSLKRFQKGQAWYSLWSTGPYTFAPHKVVWKEMSGGNFFAAYAGSYADPLLNETKIIIPDHKVYFIPAESADEAHFITGFLNSPSVRFAINAYASQLSLGTSVAEYVKIPLFDSTNTKHMDLSSFAAQLATRMPPPTAQDYQTLDDLTLKCV